jgi:hypothetical protein
VCLSVHSFRYEEVFGEERPMREYSNAEMALAAAAAALTLTRVKTHIPQVQCLLGLAMLAVAVQRKEDSEDDQKRQADTSKAMSHAVTRSAISAEPPPDSPQLGATGTLDGKDKNKKSKKSLKAKAAAEAEHETEDVALRSEVANLDFHWETSFWSPQSMIDANYLHFPRAPAAVMEEAGKGKKKVEEKKNKKKDTKRGKKGEALPGPSPGLEDLDTVASSRFAADEDADEVVRFGSMAAEGIPEADVRAELKLALQANGVLDLRATSAVHLRQALDKAMELGQTEVIAKCALGLSNAYGTSEPLDTALYLALFVSAQTCAYGRRLYEAAAPPSLPERLAMYVTCLPLCCVDMSSVRCIGVRCMWV